MEKESYWSGFADSFKEKNYYVVGESEIDIILKRVSEQEDLRKTLELACGDGIYSKVLAQNAESLLATDFSDEMVNAAISRLKDISNIKVEKANCFNLPYPDNKFDTVFMANLLHVIPEPEKAVAESKRVLKKSGRIMVVSLTPEGMTFFNKMGMGYRYFKTYGKPPADGKNLTVKKTTKILESCGFKIEEAELLGNKSKAIFINAAIDGEG